MATIGTGPIVGRLTEQAKNVRAAWGWLLALGIVQVIVGVLAVSFAYAATFASIVTLGILLLIAAGAQLAAAIWAWDWRGFFLFFLLGLLYAVAGCLTLQHPVLAAEGLTLMLAAAFLVGGSFRIVTALADPFPGWGWVLANGFLTVVMGLLIWQQWPWSGLWVLGTFVGIELIMNGVTWSMIATAVRNGLGQLSAR